jgi:hypothetical protein
MKRRVLWAAVTAGLALWGECVFVETRRGRVEVVGVDVEGGARPDARVEFYEQAAGGTFRRVDLQNGTLLYGDYLMRLVAGGPGPMWRQVKVHQPVVAVRVELQPGYVGCPPPPAEIGGRVTRRGVTGQLWVKAVAVRGMGGGEARVAETGHFLIGGLGRSTYVLMVMAGDEVVHQEVVRAVGGGTEKTGPMVIALRQR